MIINFSEKDRRHIEKMLSYKCYDKGTALLTGLEVSNINALLECVNVKGKSTVRKIIVGYLLFYGYYSKSEIAKKIEVTNNQVYVLRKKNKIEYIKVGKKLYFRNVNYIRNEYPRTINRTATGGNARSERDI